MRNREGGYIWYELLTGDPGAMQDFYADVLGWTFTRPPGGLERDYRVFSASDAPVGGVMKIPDGARMPPQWLGYISVDDVDNSLRQLEALGGTIHMQPIEIPDVGRIAMVADPQGALFYIMRGDGDEQSTAFAPMVDGHCAWNELVTTDQEAALVFYARMFSWRKDGAMPMDDMGDYAFLCHGEAAIGAMMNATERSPAPVWRYYFQVTDIDTTKTRIEAGGGRVLSGPTEVPGGDWVIQAQDPQGAIIGFAGSRGV